MSFNQQFRACTVSVLILQATVKRNVYDIMQIPPIPMNKTDRDRRDQKINGFD
jgi:hypothetical protein